MAADPDSRVKDVLDDILTLVGSGPTGLDGRLDVLESDRLTVGQATMPRSAASSGAAVAGTSGTVRLSYFTASSTFTSTQVTVYSGGTAAGATPTLVRIALYTVAANGDLTQVAATVSDTALFAAIGTAYTKSWAASVGIVGGTRYALGILVVTGAAAPTYPGSQPFAGLASSAALFGTAPRVSGAITGQTDLPASPVASASVTNSTSGMAYAQILP